jgi:hypothetical protein
MSLSVNSDMKVVSDQWAATTMQQNIDINRVFSEKRRVNVFGEVTGEKAYNFI